MDTVVWIVQVLAAIIFLMAGAMKAFQPAQKIRENMPWAKDVADGSIKFIGIAEIMGAIGLIVPQLTKIAPQLVWLSALGLSVVMILAMRLHFKRGEKKEIVVNLVFLLLLVFLIYQRF